MTTTFSDLCDFLCEPLKQAHNVSEKRRLRDLPDKHAHDVREERQRLVGSAELPIGPKIQLWAAKEEQQTLLKQVSKEEAISRKAPRTCNKPFGCGKVFCDKCYSPGDAFGRRR